MIYILLNLLPILVATAIGLMIGALWYRPRLGRALAVAGLAEFWLAAILAGALILAPPKGGVWTMTLGSAFIIWVGFVMPALLATAAARRAPLRGAAIDAGHWLVVMLAMATVMRLIGLVAPVE